MNDLITIKKRIANKNDKIAFRQFYEFYFEKLFSFALRFLKSRELAEEVVSEVFTKVWIDRSKLLEIKNLDTYLYVLVKNLSLTIIKKSLKEKNAHLSLDESHFDFAIENFTPESSYFAEELRNEIDKVVDTLPIACKNAFLLVKEDHLTYAEAGEILEISPFTVKNQVLKAVKRIREYLTMAAKQQNSHKTSFKNIMRFAPLLVLLQNLLLFLVNK
ncbi:sigma-70 family RNA polymerase sigma factor [Flammeovirgaceae bacterium SG7u.111]|nr:sigma-70 family RNA polymerase sigma factor [Flammeovirgaceae bacterium SG7u.132]WPO38428.1 sigma-70 family RNA polymerase sigma factor [Flammeovirgaceae bacterium SG7u.111]